VVDDVELVLEEVVVEPVVVVVVPEEHTSVTDRTCRFAGTSDEIGVPTGTLNSSPPTVLTCISQVDADTAGVHAPRPATTPAARPTRSLGLLNTVARLLPPFDRSQSSSRDRRAAYSGRYLL
jgi:hypothetical protein